MRIALRVFLSFWLLSLVLGGATLLAAYYSLETLVTGITTETAAELGSELGLFLVTTTGGSLHALTPEEERALADIVEVYTERSERVDSVLLIDNDGTIRAASDPSAIGMTFKDEEERRILASDTPTVRAVGELDEITSPIRSLTGGRIGTLRVRIIPAYFMKYLEIPKRNSLNFLIAMILFISLSGMLVAWVLTIPVRRLNRTLESLQSGGSGAAGLRFDDNPDFVPALRVVRGMGERLEALAARGRSSELILSTVTRALQQGVLVLDSDGKVVSANDVALRLLGVGPVSGSDTLSKLERARAALAADPRIALVLAGGPEGRPPLDLPAIEAPGAPPRPGVRMSFHPVREGDRVAGTMLLLGDLASLRAVQGHLLEAGRLSLLARLTATMAHEIKNPLNSMVINVEALRAQLTMVEGDKRRDIDETIGVIAGEIYQLDAVIRDYLGLASGGDRESGPADVTEAVEKVMRLARFEANQARVRTRAEVARNLPLVAIGPVPLRQAMLNLCLNAIQAMESGGELVMRVVREEGGVCVEVADTGPGIPLEVQGSMFDFDFTTKSGGSGLGLPITKVLVESTGGSIEFDSAPGKGTRFRLHLPIRDKRDPSAFYPGVPGRPAGLPGVGA